jgi:hypothetical protein
MFMFSIYFIFTDIDYFKLHLVAYLHFTFHTWHLFSIYVFTFLEKQNMAAKK